MKMETNEENTRRVRELEEELSDERIGEFFREGGDMGQMNRPLRARYARGVLRTVLVAGAAVACLAVALQFFTPRIVRDASMEGTIERMDCVVVAKRAYDSGGVGFGDIIQHGSSMPDGAGGTRELINRVIGLPGDEIDIQARGVYRNGELLVEPYVADGGAGEAWMRVTVPEGSCFVLGDNRKGSLDSRDDIVGFVADGDIRGKVVFRLLPVSRAGGVE